MQLPRLPELRGPIAIDTETCDLNLKQTGPGWPFKDGFVAGISISCDNVDRLYLPIAHEGGGNYDEGQVLQFLEPYLRDKRVPKVFGNAMYDLGWLKATGLVVDGPIHDVLIAAPLIWEHDFNYDLDSIAKKYLGIGKDEDKLREYGRQKFNFRRVGDIKANMWRFPAEVVREYAEQDALVTRDLYRHFAPIIEEQGLERVYKLEHDLIPVLMDMRQRGIRVDIPKAERVLGEMKDKEENLLDQLENITGVRISPTDPKSAAPALEAVGIKCPLTPKTRKPSVTKDWLESLTGEVPSLIQQIRTVNKIYTTFIQNGILEHHKNGRIHCELLSVKGDGGGTVGGRFSSRNPNMQNIPARDPVLAPLIRGLFLPEEGDDWGVCDWSSQEPRLTLHFALAIGAPGARSVANRYWEDPRTDYHSVVAEICGLERKKAKAINLGLAYGMGEAALCLKLGLPTEVIVDSRGEEREVAGAEGKAILERYHGAIPYLRALDRAAKKKANAQEFVRTISGRRCRFERVNGRLMGTHKALNRIVQGSAADQMKYAMLDLFREGKRILISVHDEIDVSIPKGDYKELSEISDIMNSCVEGLGVPFVADVEVGPTWGDAKEIDLEDV